jgi:hypothetical protein
MATTSVIEVVPESYGYVFSPYREPGARRGFAQYCSTVLR